MEKGNKRKAEIRLTTKSLILEKGYSAVTMTDVAERMGLSAGGLYYHYHSVEEILLDLIDDETKNVWELFKDAKDIDELLRCMDDYFALEKRDMLDFNKSLNCILFQYYFSFPAAEREKKMNTAYRETISQINGILKQVYKNSNKIPLLANHIYASIHGLNVLAMCGEVTEDIIDFQFDQTRQLLIRIYEEEIL
ncbi:MAG: TetR/AcrR family transcriptional regulator [Bacteroides sp.]|nr:TetR/AcrR family transcriptional regulator [Bacteroides sp.]